MFELIKAEEATRLDLLLSHLYAETEIALPAYRVLFRETEEGEFVYIILDGKVSLSKENDLGNHYFLGEKSAGSILGLPSLFTNQRYRSTAITTTECRLLKLPSSEFKKFLFKNLHLHEDILKPIAVEIDQYEKRLHGNLEN